MKIKYIAAILLTVLLLPGSLFARESDLDRELSRLTEKVVLDMNAAGEARVAFLDFVDLDGRTTRFGRFLVDELRGRFYDSRRFTVVERRTLEDVMEEQRLQLSGIISDESMADIGKLVGANTLVTGNIADLGDDVRIHVRLVSVETGTVFSLAQVTIPKDDMILDLMDAVIAEAPGVESETGEDIVIERVTTADRSRAVDEEGSGPFNGSWLLNGTIAMTLVQNGDRVSGIYDRHSGTLNGEVRGRVLAFEWSEQSPERDGTKLYGTGEITLNDDGMRLDGTNMWENSRYREKWAAIRSRTDPVVQMLVEDSQESRRGRWDGLWIESTSRELEIFHTGNALTGTWKDGSMLYGFVKGGSLSFYKILPSENRDGTLVAVVGEAILEDDNFMFTGQTHWGTGGFHGYINGIRSNEDEQVEEHIDEAKNGRRGLFIGPWLINGTDGIRLYQNDNLFYGRWRGSRDDIWGFVSGATIRFYQISESPERDGTVQASTGTATLSEDEMALEGRTSWPRGGFRSHFDGVRALGSEMVEEVIERAGEDPRSGFSGQWVINGNEPMDIRQTDHYFHATWNRHDLYGFVRGRSVTFYGVGESDSGDGTQTSFRGEGVLSENGMGLSGSTHWINGGWRSHWTGHRRLDDGKVEELRADTVSDSDGPYSGNWSIAGIGLLTLQHSGNRVYGRLAETGETIYGFVTGRLLSLYGLKEEVDGRHSGFTGALTMAEDGQSFEGRLNHITGGYRNQWNGTRR